jgi:hypothetical protein
MYAYCTPFRHTGTATWIRMTGKSPLYGARGSSLATADHSMQKCLCETTEAKNANCVALIRAKSTHICQDTDPQQHSHYFQF